MTYRRGDFNAICDRCGQKFKASQLKRTWNGLRVCSYDFEERNAQDFVRAVRPDSAPYGAKPLGEYTFLEADEVTAADL